MVPQLRFVTNQYFILVHINSVLLIMRLIISLIIETEDGENLVVLLLIKKNDCNNRLAISGIDLHIIEACRKRRKALFQTSYARIRISLQMGSFP